MGRVRGSRSQRRTEVGKGRSMEEEGTERLRGGAKGEANPDWGQ